MDSRTVPSLIPDHDLHHGHVVSESLVRLRQTVGTHVRTRSYTWEHTVQGVGKEWAAKTGLQRRERRAGGDRSLLPSLSVFPFCSRWFFCGEQVGNGLPLLNPHLHPSSSPFTIRYAGTKDDGEQEIDRRKQEGRKQESGQERDRRRTRRKETTS